MVRVPREGGRPQQAAAMSCRARAPERTLSCRLSSERMSLTRLLGTLPSRHVVASVATAPVPCDMARFTHARSFAPKRSQLVPLHATPLSKKYRGQQVEATHRRGSQRRRPPWPTRLCCSWRPEPGALRRCLAPHTPGPRILLQAQMPASSIATLGQRNGCCSVCRRHRREHASTRRTYGTVSADSKAAKGTG